jgi:hypothetical protein
MSELPKEPSFIVALAKSKVLDDYSEHEAADALLKPHIFAAA